jgi:hypothetical protein
MYFNYITCRFTPLTSSGLIPSEGLRQFLYWTCKVLGYSIHVNVTENKYTVSHLYFSWRINSSNTGITGLTDKVSGGGSLSGLFF